MNIIYKKKILIDKVIELLDVKHFHRITYDYDDNLLEDLISSALEYAENFTNTQIRLAEIDACIESAAPKIALKFPKIQNISQLLLIVKSKKITLDKEHINFDPQRNLLTLSEDFIGRDLVVKYKSGYKTAEIPGALKQGLLLHIGQLYEQNYSPEISRQIKELYSPYRFLKIA